MDISIIVPIYQGERYMDSIVRMVEENYKYSLSKGLRLQIQLIFVNDYPNKAIDNHLESSTLSIEIHNNKNNCGIHKTRVMGLKKALGTYVLFLDQDDEIYKHFCFSQLKAIQDADIVIGNGYRWIQGKYREIYKNINKQKLATKEVFFLKAANQIVSPGHCMIKRNSIPKEWCDYIITKNGGDDMFLWLLMFEKKMKFQINPELIYKHVNTGINVSNDIPGMLDSADNVILMSKRCQIIDEKPIKQYQKRIDFLRKMNSKVDGLQKIVLVLKNLDICIFKFAAFYR